MLKRIKKSLAIYRLQRRHETIWEFWHLTIRAIFVKINFFSFFPARFIWKYEQPTHLRKSSPPTYLSLLLLIFVAFLFLLHLITFLWLFPCVAVAGGADSPFRKCLHCGLHCTIRFSPWQTVSKGTALHQIKEDQNEQVHTALWWVQVGGETNAVWGTEGRETTLSSFVPPPLLLCPRPVLLKDRIHLCRGQWT